MTEKSDFFPNCPHTVGVDVQLRSINEKKKTNCYSCGNAGEEKWLCLYKDCGYVGCGPNVNDHTDAHFRAVIHPLALNLYTMQTYCYKCDSEVFLNLTAQSSNADSNSQKTGKESKYSKADDASQRQGTADKKKKVFDPNLAGYVGLKNLGNTCYVNAALQALLNCSQLTQYFLECSRLVRTNMRPMLCEAYKRLIIEIKLERNETCVVPFDVCWGIKAVNPMFKGDSQHDSQEFLRCFLDQVHEELKFDVTTPLESDEEAAAILAAAEFRRPAPVRPRSRSLAGVDMRSPVAGEVMKRAAPWPSSSSASKVQKMMESRSIISDVFNGKILSSIKCLTCGQHSHSRETFQDLSLPVVARDTSKEEKEETDPSALDPISRDQGKTRPQEQTKWGSRAYSWIKSWFLDPNVSLNDCLNAFFSEDELKEDNMYSCQKCQKLRWGLKCSRLLELPEVLVIHLKRFRHEFTPTTRKMTRQVTFPLDGLDLSTYLTPERRTQGGTSCYDLTAVICHKGNLAGGGHYVSYVRRSRGEDWVEMDDERVRVVPDLGKVSGLYSDAYVLFYSKRVDRVLSIRRRADQLMRGPLDPSSIRFFISKPWIVKLSTFAEPGPIENDNFLCQHGALQPSRKALKEDLFVEVSQRLYSYLQQAYGGGPIVTSLDPCMTCQLEEAKQRHKPQSQPAPMMDRSSRMGRVAASEISPELRYSDFGEARRRSKSRDFGTINYDNRDNPSQLSELWNFSTTVPGTSSSRPSESDATSLTRENVLLPCDLEEDVVLAREVKSRKGRVGLGSAAAFQNEQHSREAL